MQCEHNKTIGDNYGVTCQDCGAVLEGYGYYAQGQRTCKHKFLNISATEEQCIYCEEIQEREQKAN
jgi:hypothetical protein